MSKGKAAVPDAWDDDWEKDADVCDHDKQICKFNELICFRERLVLLQSLKLKQISQKRSEKHGIRKRIDSSGNLQMRQKSVHYGWI